jgi:hypothetical protein
LPLLEDFWLSQSAPQADCQIDHERALRNNFRAARESPQVMTGVAVVALNRVRPAFPNHVKLRRQNIGESAPVVRVKGTVFKNEVYRVFARNPVSDK